MTDEQLQLMMLDIDGILTRHHADTTEVLAAAQQMAVSAIVQQKFTDLLHANGGGKVERTGIETKAYVERANGSGESEGGDGTGGGTTGGNGGDDDENLEG